MSDVFIHKLCPNVLFLSILVCDQAWTFSRRNV